MLMLLFELIFLLILVSIPFFIWHATHPTSFFIVVLGLPAAFLVWWLSGIGRRRRERKLLAEGEELDRRAALLLGDWEPGELDDAGASAPDPALDLDAMSEAEYTLLLARLYRQLGYTVELAADPTGRGADLIARRGGEDLALVAIPGPAPAGQEAVARARVALAGPGVTRAVIVTSGTFTLAAAAQAAAAGIELVDRDQLEEMLSRCEPPLEAPE